MSVSKRLTIIICLITGTIIIFFNACDESTLKQVERTPEVIRPRTITIEFENYCPTIDPDPRNFSMMVARNRSTHISEGQYKNDFDADGLLDTYELDPININTYNVSYVSKDTNWDGYSDFIISQLGFDVISQISLAHCLQPDQDTDHDGVIDCEENILGLDENKFDTDNDLIPDFDELLIGTNPKDPFDASQDLSNDNLTNLEKWIKGLPLNETLSELTRQLAYSYSTKLSIINPGPQQCYNLSISNIPILNITKGNQVEIYIFEIDQAETRYMRTMRVVIPRNMTREKITFTTIMDNKVVVYLNDNDYEIRDRL